MYQAKRPSNRLVIFILAATAWLLAACGGALTNANWPGLTAEGNTVYVSYGAGVLAYDVARQQQEWLFSPQPGRLFFYAAPAVQNGRVVVGDFGVSRGFLSPGVVVSAFGLNKGDGDSVEELWAAHNIASDRIVAPPLLVDGRTFLGTADNQLVALNAETGVELWRFATGHSIWGQPSYKEGTLFVTSLDKNVYALNADSGEMLWSTELGGAIASKATVDTSLIYVTSFDRQLHALNRTTGVVEWSAPANDWIWGAPVLHNGVVYFADATGAVFAVDAMNGRSLWTGNVEGSVQTTPYFMDDVLYVASDKNLEAKEPIGVLTALSTADEGRVLWQQVLTVPIFTSPVVVGDDVVVVVQDTANLLMGFNRTTGARTWSIAPPETRR